jgi:hypothetical protein
MLLKQAIRTLIADLRAWDEQKLYDVLAFNQDGRMKFMDPCACYLGVLSSKTVHDQNRCEEGQHYSQYKSRFPKQALESAYYALTDVNDPDPNTTRRRHMDTLLRAELRRREKEKYEKRESVGDFAQCTPHFGD